MMALGALAAVAGLLWLATAESTGQIVLGYVLLGVGVLAICWARYGGGDDDGW